jgi:hypothetical protein
LEVDRGLSPNALFLFDTELTRMHTAKGTACSAYLTSLQPVIDYLANDGDWQHAYRRLPEDPQLTVADQSAVLAKLKELVPSQRICGLEVPDEGIPAAPEVTSLCELRADLYAAVLESHTAQRMAMDWLRAELREDLAAAEDMTGRCQVETLQASLDVAGELFQLQDSAWARYSAQQRQSLPPDFRERSESLRTTLLHFDLGVSLMADCIAEIFRAAESQPRGLPTRVRECLQVYCGVKERLQARYLGYVVLAAIHYARKVDPSALGRVGFHALSMALDRYQLESRHTLPRYVTWWIDERVRTALFEMRGVSEADVLLSRKIREAKQQLGVKASHEAIARSVGLDLDAYVQHLKKVKASLTPSGYRLIGRPLVRELAPPPFRENE